MKSWPTLEIPKLPDSIAVPTLNLSDSKSQRIRPIPIRSEYLMYVCGITPYDATHLGHAATYLSFDLIHRFLRARGAMVHYVQNTTDIDDPLLERAARDNVDWQELATSQIELYRSDMVALHILPPHNFRGVIESMPQIVDSIEEIVGKGATYSLDGDVYCDIHKDRNFGSRSHLSPEDQLKLFAERGGDPDRSGKKNRLDTLLWRAHRSGEPSWPSPFGEGRPGWHIECQAIALANFGIRDDSTIIDIQGGGSDLVFPHHEMSAAQTAIQTGREFADFYIHAGMIGLDGEKMSKSRGNLVLVSELTAAGVHPMAIKLALLSGHYQSDRQWSQDLLISWEKFLERLIAALSKSEVAPTHPVLESIVLALSDNLNTPLVLEVLEKWIQETEQGGTGGAAGELSRALDALLGLAL